MTPGRFQFIRFTVLMIVALTLSGCGRVTVLAKLKGLTGVTLLTDPIVQMDSVSQSLSETSGAGVASLSLSRAASAAVTVQYAFVDQSAVEGNDYTATSGSLVFAPGETSKTIPFNITNLQLTGARGTE